MSEYKRLTNNNADEYDPEYDFCVGCRYFGEPNGCNRPNGACSNYERFIETYNRLAELEDKIENGTLVELPCKVGDVMYEVIEGIPIQEWKIESICFNKTHLKGVIWAERTRDFAHWKFWIEDCGTKWFITKTEAEKRLEELKNEQL